MALRAELLRAQHACGVETERREVAERAAQQAQHVADGHEAEAQQAPK